MKLYTATGATWLPQPGRITRVFPSGLVLIQQEYHSTPTTTPPFEVGDTIADPGPCIDGAYVFPACDIADEPGHFKKSTVTAYGRANTSGTIETRRILANFSEIHRDFTFDGGLGIYTQVTDTPVPVRGFAEVYTLKKVVPTGTAVSTTCPVTPHFYNLDGTEIVNGLSDQTSVNWVVPVGATITATLTNYDIVSFGHYSEATLVWQSTATTYLPLPY